MPPPDRPAVAIIGLGLIGGSLALRLAERSYDVRGFARDASTRRAASASGITTYETREALLAELPSGSIVVLAAPLPAVLEMLPQVAAATDDSITITDVVSVKGTLRDAADEAGLSRRFVGAHPMAGTAESGFAAAFPQLLDGAKWVLAIDSDTDLTRWLQLCRLVLDTGGVVVPATSTDHDEAVAWISHLPHVIAETLAAQIRIDSLPGVLAAGSYRDATRVASTRPELVDAMLHGNRASLSAVLRQYAALLESAIDVVEAGDASALTRAGYEHRTALARSDSNEIPRSTNVYSTGEPDLAAALIESVTAADMSFQRSLTS